MPTPEARARENIDAQLIASGWVVQDRAAINLYAGRGVAVREFPVETGFADYLLFVDRKAAGVVEAKAEGVLLAEVSNQAARYAVGLPANIPHVTFPLPFLYESTGVETFFSDLRDPESRSRRVFSFHRPETLAEWISQGDSLRARLRRMPADFPLLTADLWPAQVEAVTHLEQSFAAGRPRALIQMATGSGKTFTAVNFIYRLIKYAGARRVLFLVDRNNLGRQAAKEFEQFVTPDDGRKFRELYNVQHLQSNVLDDVSKVHITTIQRLYSMLNGEAEFDPRNEDGSVWEADSALAGQPEKLVRYNPRLPVEYYDFIVTDECHRSIYNLWRQGLEYFDAFLVGLTATPGKQTLGFFRQNLVMEYSRKRAVADGVNVDGEVYRIRTEITERGSTIHKGWWVNRLDKRTRRARLEQMEEDFSYDPEDLNRKVTSRSQIQTILTALRASLPELFPGRADVPKTLIFAQDDNHAEEIVRTAREVFDRGDDFCQKITYRAEGLPETLINEFRTGYKPRIAVTVDMIATGTDIKPLEILVFMRAVRSRLLFEQMLGRGTRVITDTEFQDVTTTPGAHKTRFVIVDAVGVTERDLVETSTVERSRSVPLKSLLEAVAKGAVDDDLLSSLARRLALIEKRLTPAQRTEAASLLAAPDAAPDAAPAFTSLGQLANALLDAVDGDRIQEQAARDYAASLPAGSSPAGGSPTGGENVDPPEPGEAECTAAQHKLIERAVRPLAANPRLRSFLMEREILIDETSLDRVLTAQFDTDATARARQLIESFQAFIDEHKDEITALQILYQRPYAARRLDFSQLRQLAEELQRSLQQSDPLFLTDELWQAYTRLEKDRVRGSGEKRVLADLVSLVRHAALSEDLEPYPQRVARRYQEWLTLQAANHRAFSAMQRWWLDEIARHIGINLSIEMEDLNYFQFHAHGGRVQAYYQFGSQLQPLMDELNTVLGA